VIRKLVGFFFLYLLLEGALRKWVLPEASVELFVLKDVILFAGLVAFLGTDFRATLSYMRASEIAPWLLWIVLVTGFFVLRSPSITGLAGLRYYLAALPLILLVPYSIVELRNLERMSMAIVLITIPMCILGIVQYLSPLDSEINRYAWAGAEDESGVTSFGISEDIALGLETDRPRITSTFSYISTYAAYLQFAVVAGWVALLAASRTWSVLAGSAGLFLMFSNLAMTGSRAAMGIALVLSLPFAYLLLQRFWRGQLPIGSLLAMLLPLAGGFTLVVVDAFTAFAQRTIEGDDAVERVLGILLLPISTLAGVDPLGRGMGDTFAGMGQLEASSASAEGFNEGYEDRVGVELGYIGYLLALYLKVLFLAKTYALYRKCAERPELQVWALTSLAVQAAWAWQIPFHNAIASSFYFASIGLFLWVRAEYVRRVSGTAPKRAAPLSEFARNRLSGQRQ
jgi:hypothetical protein